MKDNEIEQLGKRLHLLVDRVFDIKAQAAKDTNPRTKRAWNEIEMQAQLDLMEAMLTPILNIDTAPRVVGMFIRLLEEARLPGCTDWHAKQDRLLLNMLMEMCERVGVGRVIGVEPLTEAAAADLLSVPNLMAALDPHCPGP